MRNAFGESAAGFPRTGSLAEVRSSLRFASLEVWLRFQVPASLRFALVRLVSRRASLYGVSPR